VAQNLIQIPPYYYWETPPQGEKIEQFKKDILLVAREYDLDLSLLMHLKFLDRVHTQFYKEHE
jgi:hypothetical protein